MKTLFDDTIQLYHDNVLVSGREYTVIFKQDGKEKKRIYRPGISVAFALETKEYIGRRAGVSFYPIPINRLYPITNMPLNEEKIDNIIAELSPSIQKLNQISDEETHRRELRLVCSSVGTIAVSIEGYIVDGYQRYEAFRRLNLPYIDCVIINVLKCEENFKNLFLAIKGKTPEILWSYDTKDLLIFESPSLELYEYLNKEPEALYNLAPRKFEELVANIFKNNGFTVELTPSTRDGGYDIFACQNNSFSGQSIYLVECKRHKPSNKVGIGIVRQLLGVMLSENKATKGIIVTSSTFTNPAIELQENNSHRLALNDYDDLTDWIRSLTTKGRLIE